MIPGPVPVPSQGPTPGPAARFPRTGRPRGGSHWEPPPHTPPEPALTPHHLPFFVYGTLLPGERNHRLLDGRTASWTSAVLPGALLFHGLGVPYPYPYAVADPAGAGTVRGAVAAVGAEAYDTVLAELDRLENYVPGNTRNHYERIAVRVRAEHGEIAAWTYFAADRIAAELLISGRRVEGGDWRRRPET